MKRFAVSLLVCLACDSGAGSAELADEPDLEGEHALRLSLDTEFGSGPALALPEQYVLSLDREDAELFEADGNLHIEFETNLDFTVEGESACEVRGERVPAYTAFQLIASGDVMYGEAESLVEYHGPMPECSATVRYLFRVTRD